MSRVEVNIGGPSQLDIPDARRGSRWFLPLAFSDDVDLSTVTAATLVMKPRPGGDDVEAALTITGDVSQVASGVVSFEASPEETEALGRGVYLWEFEFTATDEQVDGWAPLAGDWRVLERQTGGGS